MANLFGTETLAQEEKWAFFPSSLVVVMCAPPDVVPACCVCPVRRDLLAVPCPVCGLCGGLLAWFCQLWCTVCPVLCAAADCARCLQSLLLAAGGQRSLLCPDASICFMPGAVYYFSPRRKQHTQEGTNREHTCRLQKPSSLMGNMVGPVSHGSSGWL